MKVGEEMTMIQKSYVQGVSRFNVLAITGGTGA